MGWGRRLGGAQVDGSSAPWVPAGVIHRLRHLAAGLGQNIQESFACMWGTLVLLHEVSWFLCLSISLTPCSQFGLPYNEV